MSARENTPTNLARGAALAAALFVLVIPFIGYSPLTIGAIDTYVLALLVLSLNLLVGYGGMISMGHAAFFAVGGYAAGLLAKFSIRAAFEALRLSSTWVGDRTLTLSMAR